MGISEILKVDNLSTNYVILEKGLICYLEIFEWHQHRKLFLIKSFCSQPHSISVEFSSIHTFQSDKLVLLCTTFYCKSKVVTYPLYLRKKCFIFKTLHRQIIRLKLCRPYIYEFRTTYQRISLLTVGVFFSPTISPFMKSDTDYNFRKKS